MEDQKHSGELLQRWKHQLVREQEKPGCTPRKCLSGLILEPLKAEADQSREQLYESSDAERNFHARHRHTEKRRKDALWIHHLFCSERKKTPKLKIELKAVLLVQELWESKPLNS